MPSTRRSVAFGRRAAKSRRSTAGTPCRPRPTRASPARARRRARSPTAGRGTRARARATGRRAGTTRRGRAHTPRRVAGSPVGGGGCLPHASSPRAATRGETRASRIAAPHVARQLARRRRRGGIEPTSATRVTRSGATAASASACGPPADQPTTANRSTLERVAARRLRPRAQRCAPRRAGPHRSTASSRTPSAAAIESSGWRESRESPPPCR